MKFIHDWRPVLYPFLVSRTLLFSILFFTTQAHIFSHAGWEGQLYSPHVELGTKDVFQELEKLFGSSDARWYLEIADQGYDFEHLNEQRMRNWVFFPLLPLLLATLKLSLGNAVIGGVIISNIAFLIFLRVLYLSCLEERMTPERAETVLWFSALFPTSYFASVPYTESIFALLIGSSFFYIKRRNLLNAALLMSLAVLTRPTGILVLPAFGVALFLGRFPLRQILVACLPSAIAIVALSSYFYANTGDALAFIHNQQFWDRNGTLLELLQRLTSQPFVLMTGYNFIALNVAATVSLLAATVFFLRRRDWEYALLLFIPTFSALCTGNVMSMSRFILPLFPFFLFLEVVSNQYKLEKMLLVVFSSLFSILSFLYALHVTMAMT